MHKIVCLGDSLTYGYGIDPYDGSKAWPSLIQRESGIRTVNAGVPGMALLDESGYWNAPVYLRTMKKNPDAVIFWLGENDSARQFFDAANFRKGYMLMVEELLEHVERENLLVLTTIKPQLSITKDIYDFGVRVEPLKEIDDIIVSVSDYFGIHCMHPDSVMNKHPEYYHDDIHPDEKGNQALAKMILSDWISC